MRRRVSARRGGLSLPPAVPPAFRPALARTVVLVFVLGLVVGIAGGRTDLAGAGTVAPTDPRPTSEINGEPTTGSTVATGEQSPVAGGGNTPQPVGRPTPPRGQRIGDSLVWLWVMVVLVGGALAGIFARRRRSTVDGERSDAPTGQ